MPLSPSCFVRLLVLESTVPIGHKSRRLTDQADELLWDLGTGVELELNNGLHVTSEVSLSRSPEVERLLACSLAVFHLDSPSAIAIGQPDQLQLEHVVLQWRHGAYLKVIPEATIPDPFEVLAAQFIGDHLQHQRPHNQVWNEQGRPLGLLEFPFYSPPPD